MIDFLFIESNTTGTGWLFFDAVRRRGLRPVLVSADPSRYRVAPDAVMKANTADCAELVDSVLTHVKNHAVAGVWSSSEYYIGQAAMVAQHLGLPGPDPVATTASRNKAIQRARLAAAGIDQWPTVTAAAADEAIRAADRFGYPVVIKPIAGSGSVGVRHCSSAAELRTQAERIATVPLSAIEADRRMLVEPTIPGAQYSVELFGTSVIGVTRQHYGPLPYFVAVGHDFPAELPQNANDRIVRFALDACSALGLTWGPLHVELRWDPVTGQVHLIEVNPRLAGGFIPELVRHAIGIDLISATVAAALGEAPDLGRTQSRAASLRFILATGTMVDHMPTLPAAYADPLVRDARFYKSPGDRLDLVGDFHDRIGHIIAAGESADAVRLAAESAVERISHQLPSIAA